MRLSLTVLAASLALIALPARARPYLLLNADDRGFQALDLGGIDRSQPGTVQAVLIDAPLAGIPVDNRLAPLAERRIEVDCAGAWWRVRSVAYVDGKEQPMGADDATGEWTPITGDDIAAAVQAAVCQRRYNQAMVSRYFNLGQILANFQSAHSKAAPEPQTEKDLLARRYRNGR
jgi:hypothetical protein